MTLGQQPAASPATRHHPTAQQARPVHAGRTDDTPNNLSSVNAANVAVLAGTYAGIRDQILDNAAILFPIHLPDKLITSPERPHPHLPPLQLAVLRDTDGLYRAMVFYGPREAPRKSHFLFSGPARDSGGAVQNLAAMTTRMIADEAGKHFFPSADLDIVPFSDEEGGYVRQHVTAAAAEQDFVWWRTDGTRNPNFYAHLNTIQHGYGHHPADHMSEAGVYEW